MRLLRPLPIRVKYYPWETPTSYEMRLASANHLNRADLRATAGLSSSQAHFSTAYPSVYLDALAILGDLGSRSLDLPPDHHELAERVMCLQCSAGEIVHVRDPTSGYVCPKHAFWLQGSRPVAFHPIPEIIDAEHRLRELLANGRENICGTTTYRMCEELASVGIDEERRVRREAATGAKLTPLVIYPETIQLVSLLTDPTFIRRITPIRESKARRYRYIEKMVPPELSSEGRTRVSSGLKLYSDRLENTSEEARKALDHKIRNAQRRATDKSPGKCS
ncbi:hypothetical protein [Ferrimicrobium acidiphilum]